MIFREFFQALGEELGRIIGDVTRMDGPADQMGRRLRLMYGRGEINRETFFRLIAQVNLGHSIEGELDVLHRQAVLRLDPSVRALALVKTSYSPAQEMAWFNRARLEEARAALRQAVQLLEQERIWLETQSDDFWQRAQAALPDEQAARAELEIRQRLLARMEVTAARLQALRSDLRKVDLLELELRNASMDLRVLQSREQITKFYP